MLGQNANNYLQLTVYNGLNFYINDPLDLESAQTIGNALKIRIRCRSKTAAIYARLYSYNAPSGFYPSSSPLWLHWSSDTSPNVSLASTSPISVETYDKLLFTQPKMSNSPSYYEFYYNFQLSGLSYDYPPGNYNFTIMFTMTQP